MSKIVFVPEYLADDYRMLTENIESYKDPEDPDLFKNYIDSLLAQLNKTPGFLAGMSDQLAICLLFVVKVDCAKLLPLSSHTEPAWDDVKTCVNVHKNYRPLISALSDKFQHQLKIALLLICFYELGAMTEEFNADEDDSEEYEEHDEYQGQERECFDEH
jgi:hypothetical protein